MSQLRIRQSIFNVLPRFIKNFIGNSKGFGTCLKCKDSWYWKKYHVTYFVEGRGMFPLCEECYQKITPEERFAWHKKLLDEWSEEDQEFRNFYSEALETIKQKVGLV